MPRIHYTDIPNERDLFIDAKRDDDADEIAGRYAYANRLKRPDIKKVGRVKRTKWRPQYIPVDSLRVTDIFHYNSVEYEVDSIDRKPSSNRRIITTTKGTVFEFYGNESVTLVSRLQS